MCGNNAEANDRAAGWRTPIALALIVALGLALRLYRLSEQSFWIDEYFTIGTLNTPSLSSYLTVVRFFCPDNLPLYFLVQYAWRAVSGLVAGPGLRVPSLILGTACLPLIYLLGNALHSRKAGLAAAFLLALSPMHLWISQSIRPNALIEFLVLCSLYGLIRASQEESLFWWALNAGANMLLLWTHPFTVFFIAVEASFLLIMPHRNWTRAIAWGALHGLAFALALFWLKAALPYVPSAEDDFVMAPPTLREFAVDWLGDDAAQTSDPFLFQGETWRFLRGNLRDAFISAHTLIDWAMIAFFGLCVAGRWTQVSRKRTTARIGPRVPNRTAYYFLLFLVLTLPLLLMFVVSYVWRPCIQPRYTSYASLALYLIVGTLFADVRRAWLRRGLVATLAALYAYQLSFVLPASTRTDWLSVGRYITNHARAADLILVGGTYLAWDVFRFNCASTPAPMLPAFTYQSVCDTSEVYLSAQPEASVWAIVEPFIYTLPPRQWFERCLALRGLAFERTTFPGMNGVTVYRVQRDPTAQRERLLPIDMTTGIDYERILQDIGLGGAQKEPYHAALEALQQVVDTEWPRTKFCYSLLAMFLADDGYVDLAGTVARKAIALDPKYPFAHFMLAVVLGEKGDGQAALAALQDTTRADTIGVFQNYTALFHLLYAQPNLSEAKAELLRLDAMGVFLPYALRVRAGTVSIPDSLKAIRDRHEATRIRNGDLKR